MKELSIEEKAKRYDEAIKLAKDSFNYPDYPGFIRADVVFPEIKESEDERIRKALINTFKYYHTNESPYMDGISNESVVAYLEKQVEQKPADKEYTFKAIPRLLGMIPPTDRVKSYCQKLIDSLEQEGYSTDAKIVRDCLKQMNGEKVAMATMDEQKPVDKVEPKFHEGEWVIFNENHNSVYQVERIDNYRYYLRHYLGGSLSVHFDNELIRKWTIQDAKDGDVLVASDDSIFLFKGTIDYACKHYVALTTDGAVKFNEGLEHYWETSYAIHPATKEQRTFLFQGIKEAGYEWDAEKKELKKIEQRFACSEEDEEIHRKCICAMRASACGFPEEEKFVEQVDNWLKSLKERYTWKPSDEQMEILQYLCENSSHPNKKVIPTLKSLFQDLKKLREE